MRQTWLHKNLWASLGLILGVVGSLGADDKPASGHKEDGKDGHAAKVITKYLVQMHHEKKEFDPNNKEEMDALVEHLRAGDVDDLESVAAIENPMKIAADLGLWSIVIFLLLLFILRKMAWGPMLEGLQKREDNIKNSVEEAKKARADTERISAEFKVKMDQAYAEIPHIMEQARRDAEAFKEEMRTQTTKDIQAERQRLRNEIETARDQALQELCNEAAQLATLISAKAIGRSLTEEDHRRLLDEAITELGQSANIHR